MRVRAAETPKYTTKQIKTETTMLMGMDRAEDFGLFSPAGLEEILGQETHQVKHTFPVEPQRNPYAHVSPIRAHTLDGTHSDRVTCSDNGIKTNEHVET